MKTLLNFALTLLLTNFLALGSVTAQSKTELTPEQARSKIVRLGTGAKAKVTVYYKDGHKLKGYVSQAGENDFVLRDRKTDAATTIAYSDLSKIDDNRGHSTARNTLLGVAIGIGAVIIVVGIAIARAFD